MGADRDSRILWNNDWLFLKTAAGTSYEQAAGRREAFEAVDIPHDWLIGDAQNLYEDSTGWYRKVFFWSAQENADKKAFVLFEGVYMDTVVYVNGHRVGEWKYGYSAFSFEITEYLQDGENEIYVGACFRSPNSRWYSGAGIYRDVWFHVTEKTYLPEHAVYIHTERTGKEQGQQTVSDFLLILETEIAGERCDEAVVRHSLFDHNGKEVMLHAVEAGEESGRRAVYAVEGAQLWDIENPVRYLLRTELILDGEVIQTQEERPGFRYTRMDPDKGFFLNGRHLKLNGVCEHHDLGALGAAFHKPAMRRKFRILKQMGVNAVRCAHNMPAPGLVELADEMGMLLVSEAFDMWELSKTTYDYARFFKEWSARDVESWVKCDRNHPSVILWSIGNEIYDTHADAHGQEITRDLKGLVERFDPAKNAAVTISSNYIPWENAQKCADIVKVSGYNYAEAYYEEHHKKYPDWVIYGSETSSIVQSRGVYHFPLKAGILAEDDEQCSSLGNSPTSWSAKSLEACVTIDRDSDFSMGQFLWSGFDYIGEPTPYHTKNSYFGQIDTAGFPKDSFYVWQAAWTDYKKAPMVHIFPYWDFNEGQLIDVRVCSNAPFVELFINGRSLGKQKLDNEPHSGSHILADYRIPYEKGVLCAAAYDESGAVVAREEKYSFGNTAALVLTPENTKVQADGRDLLFVGISAVDADGHPVENACDRVKVSVAGAGRLVGLDNGDSTDFDSYQGVSKRLFNGRLLAIIQADAEPGEIRIEAAARGVQGAAVVCEALMPSADVLPAHTIRQNRKTEVVLGAEEEIPVRKITLRSLDGQSFTKQKDTIAVEAVIDPPEASDQELVFRTVNDTGVPVSIVSFVQEKNRVVMTAKGDGAFRLFAMSKSGTDKVRVLSQLEFTIEGLGQAYKDPYAFISASLYDAVQGEIGNGNERGISTGRCGETIVSYRDIDFGSVGSDEITIPIFALNDAQYPLQIWEGIPGEEGCELLADVVYQKPSVWNVYQPDTYRLNRRLKGITTISFHVYDKVHIKGFSFKKYERARQTLAAQDADAVYGDSFIRRGTAIEEIGNNVSLVFQEMDFGADAISGIAITGRARKGSNTIHIRFSNGTQEHKQIVEFPESAEYETHQFALEAVCGKWDVSFVFLPGSFFDFASFCFSS